jgi:hypothetical protein
MVAVALFLAPPAHAQTAAVAIGDPVTDTIELWSGISNALTSLANDLAFLFEGHQLATA